MKERSSHQHLFYGLNIAIPLILGLFLYLTLRADAYVSIVLSKFISLPAIPYTFFPNWAVAFLRNFAADILWAYALGFAVLFVLGYSPKNLLCGLFLCIGFVVLLEVLQIAGVFHGTFDSFDILLETISVCLALFFIKEYEEAQNEKSSKIS